MPNSTTAAGSAALAAFSVAATSAAFSDDAPFSTGAAGVSSAVFSAVFSFFAFSFHGWPCSNLVSWSQQGHSFQSLSHHLNQLKILSRANFHHAAQPSRADRTPIRSQTKPKPGYQTRFWPYFPNFEIHFPGPNDINYFNEPKSSP